MFDITGKHRAMAEHSTKIYLWPSSVLNTFVKRTPGLHCLYLSVAYFRLKLNVWNRCKFNPKQRKPYYLFSMACETLHYSTFLYFYWILLHYYCIFLDLYLKSGHFYSICFVSILYSMICIQYPFIFILYFLFNIRLSYCIIFVYIVYSVICIVYFWICI